MVCFEFPIIERVRTFLRLEYLFDRLHSAINSDAEWAHHTALQTLFELMECASRAELKLDMLQAMERERQIMSQQLAEGEPSVLDLKATIAELADTSAALQEVYQKFAQHLRENEWLMNIKQRMSVPGGTCQFDLPSYYLWQHLPPEERRQDLLSWQASLVPTDKAVRILLRILRNKGTTTDCVAQQGNYQQSGVGKGVHLLRVIMTSELGVVPEVSANKYLTHVRFLNATKMEARGRQASTDVPFQLVTCQF
ncbi:MAG: cell division protein ZapD [Neisseriaceae bacterium]|nr:cell division protein ZapD [Neisseriaceae bacterium]MBP6862078.1 cell division protein ZapD [Neisseriaceae bacterium]